MGEEVVVPLHCPVELVKVAVVQGTPNGLPQLILCDRVELGVADPRGVVAVDDLPDEPRVGVGVADTGNDRRPEGVRHGVGGVQPPAVGARLSQWRITSPT